MALMLLMLIFNVVFQITWLILGGLLFWSAPETCDAGFQIFMHILLVGQYFLLFGNCYFSFKSHFQFIKANELNNQGKDSAKESISRENSSNI